MDFLSALKETTPHRYIATDDETCERAELSRCNTRVFRQHGVAALDAAETTQMEYARARIVCQACRRSKKHFQVLNCIAQPQLQRFGKWSHYRDSGDERYKALNSSNGKPLLVNLL